MSEQSIMCKLETCLKLCKVVLKLKKV